MIFNVIIARMISETNYGIYSIVNNTVQTFTVFAGAGIGATLSRYVSLYRDKDKELAGVLIKTLLIFNILISIVVSLIMFYFSGEISLLISKKTDISSYLKLTSVTIFLTSLSLILQSILQGFEKYNKLALFQLISHLIMLIVGTLLTYYYKTLGAILGLLILNLTLCISLSLTIKGLLSENKIYLKFKFNDLVKEAIKKVALPAFISSIIIVPIIWLTNSNFTFINGYKEFAAFSVCLQWFTILNYIPQQLGQVKPIYTQLFRDNKMQEFKKISYKMILISFSFSLIVALFLFFISPIILKMYGNFYVDYKLAFIIMLISSVFYAIQSQFGSIFYAIGKIWLSLILNIIWSLIFIISFMILRNNGTIGYTTTYLISYSIYSIISVIAFYCVLKKKEVHND